jgi:DNA-directed RNA polymerase specialized sigma24 family protein
VTAAVAGVGGAEPRPALDYETFVAERGPDLRRALSARYGVEVGAEVMADVLALAWERWPAISAMANPTGYLFRAGQSAARRYRTRPVVFDLRPAPEVPEFDPRLPRLLEALPNRQRAAVVLVCVYDYTHAAAADVMGVSESSVRTHVRRALATLRRALGEGS